MANRSAFLSASAKLDDEVITKCQRQDEQEDSEQNPVKDPRPLGEGEVKVLYVIRVQVHFRNGCNCNIPFVPGYNQTPVFNLSNCSSTFWIFAPSVN